MSNNNTLWLGIAMIFFSSCRAFYQSAPVIAWGVNYQFNTAKTKKTARRK